MLGFKDEHMVVHGLRQSQREPPTVYIVQSQWSCTSNATGDPGWEVSGSIADLGLGRVFI